MINFQNESNFPLNKRLLTQAIRAALQQQSAAPDAELSLVFVDNASMQAYNRDYRGLDEPTDVLSFPSGEIDPDSDAPYLGDIILSYPKAQAQAEAGGHPLAEELQLLTVHGVLHLLGHDHYEEDEKSAMWAAQDEILTTLGVGARPTN